jgi:hypothetical protein
MKTATEVIANVQIVRVFADTVPPFKSSPPMLRQAARRANPAFWRLGVRLTGVLS